MCVIVSFLPPSLLPLPHCPPLQTLATANRGGIHRSKTAAEPRVFAFSTLPGVVNTLNGRISQHQTETGCMRTEYPHRSLTSLVRGTASEGWLRQWPLDPSSNRDLSLLGPMIQVHESPPPPQPPSHSKWTGSVLQTLILISHCTAAQLLLPVTTTLNARHIFRKRKEKKRKEKRNPQSPIIMHDLPVFFPQ